jgi:hypothetical protein
MTMCNRHVDPTVRRALAQCLPMALETLRHAVGGTLPRSATEGLAALEAVHLVIDVADRQTLVRHLANLVPEAQAILVRYEGGSLGQAGQVAVQVAAGWLVLTYAGWGPRNVEVPGNERG